MDTPALHVYVYTVYSYIDIYDILDVWYFHRGSVWSSSNSSAVWHKGDYAHTHAVLAIGTLLFIFFLFVLGSWGGESSGGLLQDAPTRTR